MNFKFDDKDYDSDKLSDNGKLYLGKLQNIGTKEHCVSCVLENQDTTEEEMQSNLSAQIEEQKAPALTSKTKEW